MEKKPPYGKKVKNLRKIPKTPPIVEEPIGGLQPGKVHCEICGKAYATKSQLERHMLTQHKSPEGRE